MYLSKTPNIIQSIFPDLIWKMKKDGQKSLYLTFDDGPIPIVTEWVLDQLDKYQAKASFFCVGQNVEDHKHIFQKIINQGHVVGNHTYNHISGWKNDAQTYITDIERCATFVNGNLFRPPYGRLKPSQVGLLKENYKIVMWDILSGDFDPKISNRKCLENVLNKSEDGSIIVFHDSLKAKEKLEFVLPKVLAHFSERGYSFKKIKFKN